MPWAKLHTDILGDVKLMRAARKGAKGLHLFPWLIAFAKEADDDGRLTIVGEPAEPRDIADQIPGVTSREVQACLSACLAIGILTRDSDGALRLTAWESRSGGKASDHPSAVYARVKRHRAKKRNAPVKRGSNADDNALQITRSNAREREEEVEGEEEKDKNKNLPAQGAGARTAASDPGHSPPGQPSSANSTANGEHPPPPTPPPRGGWPAELATVAKEHGFTFKIGQIGAVLKEQHDQYGVVRLREALAAYLEETPARFVSLQRFAERAGALVEDVTPLNELPPDVAARKLREAAGAGR